ncbi:hypothetical protein ACVI1J_009674 [Bradyrhizobium diazoefficiens]
MAGVLMGGQGAVLADYLGEVAARACAYGRLDCAVLMADWVVRQGWPDPMPDRRGTYTTERDYRAAVRSEGGLVASCRRRFGHIGLVETVAAEAGDVALVLVPVARGGRNVQVPAGAIVLGGGLVALLDWPRGIVGVHRPTVAAWSVAHQENSVG